MVRWLEGNNLILRLPEDEDEEEIDFSNTIVMDDDDDMKPHNYVPVLGGGSQSSEGKKMTDKLGNLLTMQHSSVNDANHSFQIQQKFIAETEGDIFFERIPLVLNGEANTIRSIVDKIKEALTGARAVMPYGDSNTLIHGSIGDNPMLISVDENTSRRKVKSYKVNDIGVTMLAHPDAIEVLKAHISASFKDEKIAEIKWWTQAQHGNETRDIYLPKVTTKLHPEFYPDMGDPTGYIADYISAPESVLLIAGPPGTGKTTLLRHMISNHNLGAHVIYEEAIMQKDAVFQNFLFDEHGDLMIIEDADTILGAREAEGNKLMSRFLNVADGLIKLPNKKLVFTTNITDFSKVDSALLRPGRCYGVLHTRLLNLSEAQAAAKVAGVPVPLEKREYSIADLFNQGKRQKVRTIGFGVNH